MNDIFAVDVDTEVADPIVGADSAVVKLTALDATDVPAVLVAVAVNEYVVFADSPVNENEVAG